MSAPSASLQSNKDRVRTMGDDEFFYKTLLLFDLRGCSSCPKGSGLSFFLMPE